MEECPNCGNEMFRKPHPVNGQMILECETCSYKMATPDLVPDPTDDLASYWD